jgi:hypothetical protein
MCFWWGDRNQCVITQRNVNEVGYIRRLIVVSANRLYYLLSFTIYKIFRCY